MTNDNPLPLLAAHFAFLSLIAVGGANTVIPEIYRFAVDTHGWMSGAEFADLFAISQVAPLRAVVLISLVGWKVAGVAGGLVSTAAICGPSCVLTYGVAHVWHRMRTARWRTIVQAGLAPVTIGLTIASGYILTSAADQSWTAYAVTGATVLVLLRTELNPLWLLGAAGLLGALGAV